MIKSIKDKAKQLLESGTIDGFLCLRDKDGHIGPHLFCEADELGALSLGDRKRPGDSRYPLNRQLLNLARNYPDKTFGVLVRGCDERGLRVLFASNQLNSARVVTVGISCPGDLARACECLRPFPEELTVGDKGEGEGIASDSTKAIEDLEPGKRFSFWMREFEKCIKCYGCRNICPQCFCMECSLEKDHQIHTGDIPPESPLFHLTRAIHMVGRCIDCGLCNEACPADIPLRTLYKKVADIVDDQFDYRPGYDLNKKSPLNELNTGGNI